MDKLRIDYPCPWDYRLIGEDEARMRAAVAEVVGAAPHVLTLANRSRTMRYCSLQLTLQVHDEAERVGTFERLRRLSAVRYVL